ncbi:SdpI family protein [Bacillus cereus group sp. BfR-BA-01380]|uniref:SdpI family protein n=1 Tax=Bacillus cereus group sp. BfR-BA-01380 TaxID=2920324 RepID=UPI001F5A1C62|nr:SdpI family protein [Bacillus cereus group sp. BfR-BA-01380]
MKKHIFAIILISITIFAWIISWPHLPDTIATHWSGNTPDGYSSKLTGMLLMVGIMIGTYILLNVVPKIDPKRENYKKFSKSFAMITYSVLVVLFIVNIDIIASGLGYDLRINRFSGLLVGVLFLVIGNYLPQCKPNYFIGIRTPWTLSNEEVWRKTHRFSGKVFMILGIIMCGSIFAPVTWGSYIILTVVLGGVVITMLYSYLAYKKEMGV